MTTTDSPFLNRFTTIPFLIDMLTRKQLTLLNPNSWEDYNDRVTVELYRTRKNAHGIYALCLTDKRETVHHWNAFANGTSGCCIEFSTKKLLKCVSGVKGIIHGRVDYVKIQGLNKYGNDIEKLPYIKREPFLPESEYRIMVLSDEPQRQVFDIPIDLGIINRITVSNKLPEVVFKSLEHGLYRLAPDFKGKISHSTLFNNSKWINHFNKES